MRNLYAAVTLNTNTNVAECYRVYTSRKSARAACVAVQKTIDDDHVGPFGPDCRTLLVVIPAGAEIPARKF